jgi:hypothetical protein
MHCSGLEAPVYGPRKPRQRVIDPFVRYLRRMTAEAAMGEGVIRSAIVTPEGWADALLAVIRSEQRGGMLTVETIGRIRREHFIKGKTIREIARDLKAHSHPELTEQRI